MTQATPSDARSAYHTTDVRRHGDHKMSPPFQTVDAALIAAETAQALLELHAVLVYEGRPFIYTTGWASPVYVDCHRVMSRPDLRRGLMDHAAALLRSRLSGAIDVVAGAE